MKTSTPVPMKRVLSILLLLVASFAQAQFNESSLSVKLGAGYAQDFPGLGGYAVAGELAFPMMERLEGAVGLKRMSMQGHPRTSSVKEYTLATTVDFNVFFLPVNNGSSIVRVGGGYAFAFYNIRRSYPVSSGTGADKVTHWPVQDQKGKSSGLSIIGEYEYLLPESNISLGLRAAWYKAYDRVTYVGPFAAIRF